MTGIIRVPRRRALVALIAVLPLAAGLVVVGRAAPAQAAYCSGPPVRAWSPVAVTDFAWDICDDRTVQIWDGILHDTNCDGRTAHVNFYNQFQNANGLWLTINSNGYKADTGCGNWATYPRITLNPGQTPGRDCLWCPHRLRVVLFACSWSCSGGYETYFPYTY
jgi:hypothetical protein